ncbi:protein of unknown function DUF239 [Macleaya cordata]|uniref:Neprosin PEP catalytic domain-containing protein n=1 Tax=Macleaya cordata TaxID=56857 RepID=A0A200QHK0_MACCD|nr:protein of unknown function DUF239 [Macleaya cordata]
MRPTSQPKVSITETPSSEATRHSTFKRLDCPDGTVPIRRTRKEDLIRAKSFFESYSSSINEVTKVIPGQEVAIRTSRGTEQTNAFHGVHGYINVANPKVGMDQFSAGQVWVEGGPPDQLNTLQAGWAVAPQLFGDNLTRIFAFSNTDVQRKQGCYNLLCQGFVQVDRGVAIGSDLSPISVYKGDQYIIHLTIFQDVKGNGDWWLLAPDDKTLVGYWPKDLFPNLHDGAQSIAWGGLVKGTPDGPTPQMGNGEFPNHHYDEACSVVHLQVVNSNGDLEDQFEAEFLNFLSSPHCYNLEYSGFIDEDQRYSFLFGGPGGDNCGP